MGERLLTVRQESEYLQLSDSTIRRYERKGILKAMRDPVNNYRLFPESVLAEFKRQYVLDSRAAKPQGFQQLAFRFIDLFAGIGGLRIAFERAGGNCVFTSEIDRFAAQTYEANYDDYPEGDITNIPSIDIPPHEILLAGFPCQPFSLAGVSKKKSLNRPHGFEDPTQGTLFFEIKRILKDKRPRAFLLENVKNLRSHDGGKTFEVIRRTLEDELGYTIFHRVLDASCYVPQRRERVFIVGFEEDVSFEWPDLPMGGPTLISILEDNDAVDQRYTLSDKLWQYLQDYAEGHRKKGNGFGFGLFGPEDVARTLSARYYKDGSEILIKQGGGKNPRRLTPSETRALMGFPGDFKIPVSDTQAYKQFGNAVVVPVVIQIARSMIEALRSHYGSLMELALFERDAA